MTMAKIAKPVFLTKRIPSYLVNSALLVCLLGGCQTQPNKTPAITAPVAKPIPLATPSKPVKPAVTRNATEQAYYSSLAPHIRSFIDNHQAQFTSLNINAAELLARQTPNFDVIKLISPPTQALRKNWHVYRSRFVNPIRIQAGYTFWQQHKPIIEQVEQTYGVPAYILLGILGVESIYGKHMGSFNVLNSLYTLAFFYPETANKVARQTMFQEQLRDYLILSAKEGHTNHIGSYAAASGMPQFMPTSIMRYAVDYDKDGKIDLRTNVGDVLASTANFLKQHGWQTKQEVVVDLNIKDFDLVRPMATGNVNPTIPVTTLQQMGFKHIPMYANDSKALIIDLPSGVDVQYKIGLQNFYVLTRYNQSFFYALSVYDLGKAIAGGN